MKKHIQFSVVIPVLNEENNITPLILELQEVLQGTDFCKKFLNNPEGDFFEVIFIDDHSKDQSWNILQSHAGKLPWLKALRLSRQSGQSSAIRYGVKAARFPLIVTLDGDGQNDPDDILRLIEVYSRLSRQSTCCLVNGWRAQRKDSG